MKGTRKNQKGFSLAEALMATVVLGIAAAGVLLPFVNGASVRAEGARRTLAAQLASDLMEEIVKIPFEQITTTYGSYTETEGQIKNSSGALFSDAAYANFSRGASCAYDASQPFFVVVTVWVKYKGSEIVSLSRLVSK
ncbi:MAG: prepilin-type N-terminal cleavage/methylation domain-containing protein [Sedimentisphaerales bacterium]|nr:prepilin-type N-terminal cleavage/methylation domain-containing protein [Sedimentisphaerales bacterium]